MFKVRGVHCDTAPLAMKGIYVVENSREHWFSKIATETATGSGRPWAFGIAGGFVIGWLVTGPVFHFSDTWQLVMNTISSIVTFLMVFLIQNAQNRDSTAVQLSLMN
jgi:low affinity Fe/Cu permease